MAEEHLASLRAAVAAVVTASASPEGSDKAINVPPIDNQSDSILVLDDTPGAANLCHALERCLSHGIVDIFSDDDSTGSTAGIAAKGSNTEKVLREASATASVWQLIKQLFKCLPGGGDRNSKLSTFPEDALHKLAPALAIARTALKGTNHNSPLARVRIFVRASLNDGTLTESLSALLWNDLGLVSSLYTTGALLSQDERVGEMLDVLEEAAFKALTFRLVVRDPDFDLPWFYEEEQGEEATKPPTTAQLVTDEGESRFSTNKNATSAPSRDRGASFKKKAHRAVASIEDGSPLRGSRERERLTETIVPAPVLARSPLTPPGSAANHEHDWSVITMESLPMYNDDDDESGYNDDSFSYGGDRFETLSGGRSAHPIEPGNASLHYLERRPDIDHRNDLVKSEFGREMRSAVASRDLLHELDAPPPQDSTVNAELHEPAIDKASFLHDPLFEDGIRDNHLAPEGSSKTDQPEETDEDTWSQLLERERGSNEPSPWGSFKAQPTSSHLNEVSGEESLEDRLRRLQAEGVRFAGCVEFIENYDDDAVQRRAEGVPVLVVRDDTHRVREMRIASSDGRVRRADAFSYVPVSLELAEPDGNSTTMCSQEGCTERLSSSLFSAALFCYYSGGYFCHRCHVGDKAAIPARLVHLHDRRKMPVCVEAAKFLRFYWTKPCIPNIVRANQSIYSQEPILEKIRALRIQLLSIAPFVLSCTRRHVELQNLLVGPTVKQKNARLKVDTFNDPTMAENDIGDQISDGRSRERASSLNSLRIIKPLSLFGGRKQQTPTVNTAAASPLPSPQKKLPALGASTIVDRTYMLFKPVHRFSPADLELISFLPGFLENILEVYIVHVTQECIVCSNRGYYCGICENDDLIFPFQPLAVFVCPDCRTCYHKSCIQALHGSFSCKACLRLSNSSQRRRMRAGTAN